MRIAGWTWTILVLLAQPTLGDPISLAIGGVYHAVEKTASTIGDVAGGAVLLAGTGLIKFRCRLYECCSEPYIVPNFHNMKTALEQNVYGQHLVLDTVWNAVMAHWKTPNPKKPLVLSFHGPTGTGKNHVCKQIVNNTYKNEMRSSFVHAFSLHEYEKMNRTDGNQMLRERILSAVKKCERSIFIFDEVDKMPEQLLSSIKPFLDYYDQVAEVDFRRSIFILLSNKGGKAIADIAKDYHLSGKKNREDLTLKHFEDPIMNEAYNEEGGLKNSKLIMSQLIDHFVPFLPLERQHVVSCTEDYLRTRGRHELAAEPEFVDKIVNSLEYFPKGLPVFSSSGCKRVAAKAELEMNKRKPSHSLDGPDEL